MFTRINSSGIQGIGAYPVSVEADVANGLPGFSISGQLSTEVREAQERVRTALKNSGFQLPAKKITVNLSPAGVKKGGTAFDLPIAVAVLGAFGVLDTGGLGECLVIGELGLDGSVKPVPGVLVHTEAARAGGLRQCILPGENEREGRLIKGIQIIGICSLKELVQTLARPDWKSTGQKEETEEEEKDRSCEGDLVDFKEINGQGVLRRAAEVAAAGRRGGCGGNARPFDVRQCGNRKIYGSLPYPHDSSWSHQRRGYRDIQSLQRLRQASPWASAAF